MTDDKSTRILLPPTCKTKLVSEMLHYFSSLREEESYWRNYDNYKEQQEVAEREEVAQLKKLLLKELLRKMKKRPDQDGWVTV